MMQQDDIRGRMVKFYARGDGNVTINATQGHFATSQSHINYYIDVTRLKVRVSEAQEAAKALRQKLLHNVQTVDTIVCLEGTEVLGAFLAQELEKGDFLMTNTHETMYVVEPEENSMHQLVFRDNIRLAIEGKNVLALVSTVTTGESVKRSIECIEYYGGMVGGVAAIFSTMTQIDGKMIYSLFDQVDLPGYATYAPHDCPLCKQGTPIEAIVNAFGYSKL